MNPQELANFLGLETTQELAHRMIQEAVRLPEHKVVVPGDHYTRPELNVLAKAINEVLGLKINNDEGKTYERFFKKGRFGRTKVTNRLCAYILHMSGEIQYEPRPAEPGNNYWLLYCNYATGQPIHEPANEDTPSLPVIFTKKYRAYFFSHIRYNVWENGTIEMRYETENSGTVSGMGFYRGVDDAFAGNFKIEGNHICMDLEGRNRRNWFRLIGKVDGDKMKDASYFRAAYVTISSYAEQYTSAIEVVFLEEKFAMDNPEEELKVKRYLMLQRHRFQSGPLTANERLIVLPSQLRPNNIERITGNYACVSQINDHILVSSLVIEETYRTIFETKIYQKSGQDKNYQMCYLELIPSAPDYIHVKGYKASKNTEEPALEHLLSTLTIPVTINDAPPIRGTFNSLVELNGKEILWAGDCYFIKLDGEETIKPFMCRAENLEQNLKNYEQGISDTIRNIINWIK